jgi:hypothetical protein
MIRCVAERIAALGMVALLQVGGFAHLDMLCYTGDTSHANHAEASAPAGDHHAHHGAAAETEAAQGESDSQSEHESHGQCNLCCPKPAPPTVREHDLIVALEAPTASLHDPQAPALRRAPHLLPYPNPPPTV